MALELGLNYAWRAYGFDFGAPPKSFYWTRDAPPRLRQNEPLGFTPEANQDPVPTRPWMDGLDRNLECFKGLGVTKLRWFILADALNYGRSQWDANDVWTCNAPRLAASITDDFQELLERCRRAKIQLIPVVLNHAALWPGRGVVWFSDAGKNSLAGANSPLRRKANQSPQDWVATLMKDQANVTSGCMPGVHRGGRGDFLGRVRESFLDNCLEPLLKAGAKYRDVIFAWDVMNEPEQAFGTPYYGDGDVDQQEPTTFRANWKRPFSNDDMDAFLLACAKRIAGSRHQYTWTIGFDKLDALKAFDTKIPSDLRDSYKPQFHYYTEPKPFPAAGSAPAGAILGEFALGNAETWTLEKGAKATTLAERIDAIRAGGYALAWAWSVNGARFGGQDARSAWSTAVAKALAEGNGKTYDCEDVCFPPSGIVTGRGLLNPRIAIDENP